MDGAMAYKIVGEVSVTTIAASGEYTFTVRLNQLELARMSRTSILGFSFPKEKYQFLNEIANLLTAEILEKLEDMTHD